MRKIVFFSLSLAMILGLGFATNGVMAEDTQTLNDEDFEVEYLAAPAVAGELLEEAGIDNRYGTGRDGGNYIKDVAQKMNEDSDTNFNNVEKTDVIAYECAVAEFLNDEDNGDNYPAGVISQYEGVPDPDASNAEFTDNQDGTGTMSITVKDGCGNGIEELGMDDISIIPESSGTEASLTTLDGYNCWGVQLTDDGNGVYTVELNFSCSLPYKNQWDIQAENVKIEKGLTISITDVTATLKSVEYVGTCDRFGSHENETLTLVFSNDVFFDGNDQLEAKTYVHFEEAYRLGYSTNHMNYVPEDNKVVITSLQSFSDPRPEVGDRVTDLEGLVDSIGNDVIVPEDGVEVVQVGGECLMETINVSSTGNTYSTDYTLKDGSNYRIEASGTYRFANWGEYGIADAAWNYRSSTYAPDNNAGWYQQDSEYLQLWVDGDAVEWQPEEFNSDHIYSYNLVGTGSELDFTIPDTNYSDNSGSIEVKIYEVW